MIKNSIRRKEKARSLFLFVSLIATTLIVSNLLPTNSTDAFAKNHCDALKPSEAGIISEEFKGQIEGDLQGLASRFVDAGASISGEYSHFAENRLNDFPDSHRLYVWQRTLYLACVDPDSGIDINKLLELYLIDPVRLSSGGAKGIRSYFSGDSVYLDGKIQAVISGVRKLKNGRSLRISLALRNITDKPLYIAMRSTNREFANTDMGDKFSEIEVSGFKYIGSLRRDTFENKSNYSRLYPSEDIFMIWDIALHRDEEEIFGSVVNLSNTIIYLEDGKFQFIDFRAPSIGIPR